MTDTKLGSSVSFKKLTPVNCISCYPGPGQSSGGDGMGMGGSLGMNNIKKSIMRKL